MGIKKKKPQESYVLVELDELLWVIKFIGRWGRANYVRSKHFYQDITEEESDSLIADFPMRRWQDSTEGYHIYCISADEAVQEKKEKRAKGKMDAKVLLNAFNEWFLYTPRY